MRIVVRLYGYSYLATGVMETVVDLPEGSTVADLLNRLLEIYPGLDGLVIRDGSPAPYHRITVNGRDIDLLSGVETVLSEGDVVALHPPAGG